MKKLSNTECELKKSVAYKKKRVVLNYRFSYFRPFPHDMIWRNTTHSNIYIFTGAILQARHLGRGRE